MGLAVSFCGLGILYAALRQWLISLDSPTRAAVIAAVSTFVTAVIALVGVGLNLYWNRRGQREERLITLRRDAYLKASKAYAVAAQALASIADPSVKLSETLPAVRDLAAAVGKIHLVGNARLIEAITRFQETYTSIYMGLVIERVELDRLYNEFNQNNARIVQLSNYQLQSEAAIQIVKEISKLHTHSNKLSGDLLRKQQKMLSSLGATTIELAQLSAKATLAAKEEFEIALDEDRYLKLVTNSAKSIVARMEENLKRLEPDESNPG